MGEIISLRRACKDRDKRAKEDKAQTNRVAFGRTKAERELSQAQALLDAAKLDAHKREPADEPR